MLAWYKAEPWMSGRPLGFYEPLRTIAKAISNQNTSLKYIGLEPIHGLAKMRPPKEFWGPPKEEPTSKKVWEPAKVISGIAGSTEGQSPGKTGKAKGAKAGAGSLTLRPQARPGEKPKILSSDDDEEEGIPSLLGHYNPAQYASQAVTSVLSALKAAAEGLLAPSEFGPALPSPIWVASGHYDKKPNP